MYVKNVAKLSGVCLSCLLSSQQAERESFILSRYFCLLQIEVDGRQIITLPEFLRKLGKTILNINCILLGIKWQLYMLQNSLLIFKILYKFVSQCGNVT